ncbi:MAG: 1,4-dihydroxy-2-naphthoate octaprenyltransferase [Bacteroidaceae bacterium]|nr:1,4-dihydroxy-2-naphthoate octaprenyltransferase [Bacteroidaceae bacterium]
MVKTNSLRAWWLAARPKTLTGAAAPVILAVSAAYGIYGQIEWTPALLCMAFALLMQTDANLVNDYFDCIRGVDTEERLGPERACSQGWITLPAMRTGIAVTTLLACLAGLPLVWWGGWECILVGMACVVFCFLYTTLFSRIAMGDVLVLLFFGIIPVGYTFFFQSPLSSITEVPLPVWLLSLAQGLVTDCLLLVNNFRDRHTDAAVGKTTLVTIIGERPTLVLYGAIGIISVLLAVCALSMLALQVSGFKFQDSDSFPLSVFRFPFALTLPFLFLHLRNLHLLHTIHHGKALNRVLGMTAMSIFLFALLTSVAIVINSLN